MSKSLKADLMLFIVVICWGFSFYLIDIGMSDMESFNLSVFRYLIAFIVSALVLHKKLKNINKKIILSSLILGVFLASMQGFLNYGVKHTTLSNSGFLPQIGVITTPIIASIVNRKLPRAKVFLVSIICLIGIALLTIKDGFKFSSETLTGDIFCLLAGVSYSVYVVATEIIVRKENVDAIQLGVMQLLSTGLISLVLSLIFEKPHFPSNSKIYLSVILLAIFCTALAFIIQIVAQKYTEASHVSLILSLEAVFAGLVAYLMLGEVLSLKAYFGAFLMLLSVFLMEISLPNFFKKKGKKYK